MTSRADLIEAAARALWPTFRKDPWEDARLWDQDGCRESAEAVLDVVLPQVTTLEEWAALPFGAIAVSPGGTVIHRTVDPDELRHWWGRETLFPLTVVWQPSADRVTT